MLRALIRILWLSLVVWANAISSSNAKGDESTGSTYVRRVVLVRGASGTPEYGRQFDTWTSRWEQAAKSSGCDVKRIGPLEGRADVESERDHKSLLTELQAATNAAVQELWVVLIGHGTFDGKTARFNLRGDDVSSVELKTALASRTELTAIVNCSAASSPFMQDLKGPQRIVITASKSGAEVNFARFGDYLSSAIGDVANDLDKDGQTSLLEAFLKASRQTKQFYDSDGRLETEHAVLDDNGDGQGIRADWFRGFRLIKKPEKGVAVDGQLAHQMRLTLSPRDQKLAPELRRRRDDLVRSVLQLRQRKGQFKSEDDYFGELEKLCLEIAELDRRN